MPTTHRVICPLCEAMCGLRVEVRDAPTYTIGRITGDPDDVWSRGHLCPKGTALGHLHEDPSRLRRPVVRRGDRHHEVSWDDAWAEVERVLRPVLDTDGAAALTVYVGNPVAHNLALARYIGALIGMGQAVGMGAYYSPATVDQWPLNLVSAKLYGGMWNSPVPDLDHTDLLLVLGANPAASQGSMLSAPDVMGRLAAIRERGGSVVVVDPRRTPTAAKATEWVPVRPGTDALLLFAVLRTLAHDGLLREHAHLAGLVAGLAEVIALAEPFTPEAVAGPTGVPAATVRRLAHDLAAASAPALYSRIGTCTQEFGSLTTWLVHVIGVALGAVDRSGGMLFPEPSSWSPMFMKPPDQTGPGWETGRFRSRVRGAPEVFGQYPVSCLAEEITTPGEGRLRALITVAGNPAVSSPGARALAEALPGLDAMVSVDNWLNETSRQAHVVLPGLSPLEQPHTDDLYWMYAVRSCVKWTDPAVPPPTDRPEEWQVLLRLAGALLGTPVADVDVASMDDLYTHGLVQALCAAAGGNPLAGRDPDQAVAALRGHGPERLADLGIRVGAWGDQLGAREGLTLDDVRRHPDGIELGGLEAGRLAAALETPSGTIELLHDELVSDVPRLLERLGRPDPGLVLTSRRHLRSNNSWLNHVPALTRGPDRCTLLMHPEDAVRAGVSDGDVVCVGTREGELSVPVAVSDEMMPGVVSLPHGWAEQRNSNLLNPGDVVDVPSGTIAVNGVPCRVEPAGVTLAT
ncbi:MAG: molybdopterin dinucleotide-binding protein [Nocardioides sp.]|nr:molybdopterin dinucleotide-binding protein [Nocardioides sp.]